VKTSFNIQELLHCKSKNHGTKPMHPSSLRAFQRHQEDNLKHLGSMDFHNYKTKQNKLPSFIDRLCIHALYHTYIWIIFVKVTFSKSIIFRVKNAFVSNVFKWGIKIIFISSSPFALLIINVKILSNFQKEWCTFGRKNDV
jgi:hypothetical protein